MHVCVFVFLGGSKCIIMNTDITNEECYLFSELVLYLLVLMIRIMK